MIFGKTCLFHQRLLAVLYQETLLFPYLQFSEACEMKQMKFNKIAVFLLGFFCIWPVFIDVISWKILAIKLDQSHVTASIVGGVPVPMGFFSLALFVILFVFSKKKFRLQIPGIILQFGILLALFSSIGFLKVVALFTPIVWLYALEVASIDREKLARFSDGFLVGVITFYMLNVLSYLFCPSELGGFGALNAGRQVFGYEIYQFFVSYSAVASLIFGASSLLLLASKNELRYSKLNLLAMSVLSGIVVVLAYRKAAMIDLFFLSFLSVVYMLKYLFCGKIKAWIVIIVPCVFVFNYHSYVLFGSIRDISINNAIEQRIDSYLFFLHRLVSLDVISFLFGYEIGFGGYSNLFIDLFVRGGFVGLIVYLFFLFNAGYRYYQSLYNFRESDIRGAYPIYSFVLIFVLFNVVVGNVVNLNLSVPYYVVNLISILAVLSTGVTSLGAKKTFYEKRNYHYAKK